MIAEVLQVLRCPYCDSGLFEVPGQLTAAPRALACTAGHSFDIARQGYVSLLSGGARAGTADTAAMVDARARLLAAGHFEPIAAEVASVAQRAIGGVSRGDAAPGNVTGTHGLIVEVGAGTAYYLGRVLDQLPGRSGLALDISKYAARRAAQAHGRAEAVVCDVWRALPIASASAAVVLDIFAPRNSAEMARILAPGGALIVVTPTVRHLQEIVAEEDSGMLTVDPRKGERLAAALRGHFRSAEEEHGLEYTAVMTPEEVAAAVAMGPSAHHGAGADGGAPRGRAREVTVSVRVGVYRACGTAHT